MTPHSTLAEHYANVTPSDVFEVRTGGTFGIEMFLIEHQDIEAIDPAVDHITIRSLICNSSPLFEFDFGSGRYKHDVREANADWVNVQPAHQNCSFRKPGRNTILGLCVPCRILNAKLEEVGFRSDPFEKLYASLAYDRYGAALLNNLWQLSNRDAAADQLFIDSGVLSLVGHLCSRAKVLPKFKPLPDLPDRRLQRLIDYVEEHLSDPLTINDLSLVAGISVGHFPRAFRKATGQSPHAYVMSRRINRAQHLLITPERSITNVALRAGFASGSHFATVFKRVVGVSPSSYRETLAPSRLPIS